MKILKSDNKHSGRLIIIFLFLSSFSTIRGQNAREMLHQKMDSLIFAAIDSMAFSGAQVLVMHKGEKILHKAYGYHTYDKKQSVALHHLYDLASVTKVMAGGLALMKMQEEQRFTPDETLAQSFKSFSQSAKSDILWKEVLAHQSGMKPYIVFWQTAKRKNGKYKYWTFKNEQKGKYQIQIDSSLYLHNRYPKKMHKMVRNSELNAEKKYLYSGLGFLLIPDLVFQRTGQQMDQYLRNSYFNPLGIERICFQPNKYFDSEEIVPTEIDTFFRKKLVRNFVHDENASMLNGISANAGLFANAASLGEISQMLLNKGSMGDKKFLNAAIIEEYTSVQYPLNDNRRGLTFDKPPLDEKEDSYISKSASPSSFGHSGFTGTFFWIDPQHDLVFILLTNRVYPYRSQRKIYSMNLRPKLHQLAYDYVFNLKP